MRRTSAVITNKFLNVSEFNYNHNLPHHSTGVVRIILYQLVKMEKAADFFSP